MQFGGGNMGGVNLVASNDATQDFRNTPKGPIDYFLLTIGFSLLSTGAAFALVVDTEGSAAAEGVDDLDLILNAVFLRLTMLWDPGHQAFALTPAQLRTILGLFNQRDFLGTMDNADQVPVSTGSATAFSIVLKIPVALIDYFDDGNIFRNGSTRLSTGSMIYSCKSSLTPNVVLANGTAAVSGMSVSMAGFNGAGSEHDVGMTWTVKRPANLPTQYAMAEGIRLAVLDSNPVDTSAVTNWVVAGYAQLLTPAQLGARYQGNRLRAGGFDITKRATPLLYVERERQFHDWLGHKGRDLEINAVSGVSSLTVYDVLAISPPPAVVADVSREAGKGGPVTIVRPTPATIQPGTPIPPALQDLVPFRIQPGRLSDGGTGQAQKTQGPADVASEVVKNEVNAKRATGFLNFFGRK